MVGEARHIEADPLHEFGEFEDTLRAVRRRFQQRAEGQIVTVVDHEYSLPERCYRTA
jgi:hypothetical protein